MPYLINFNLIQLGVSLNKYNNLISLPCSKAFVEGIWFLSFKIGAKVSDYIISKTKIWTCDIGCHSNRGGLGTTNLVGYFSYHWLHNKIMRCFIWFCILTNTLQNSWEGQKLGITNHARNSHRRSNCVSKLCCVGWNSQKFSVWKRKISLWKYYWVNILTHIIMTLFTSAIDFHPSGISLVFDRHILQTPYSYLPNQFRKQLPWAYLGIFSHTQTIYIGSLYWVYVCSQYVHNLAPPFVSIFITIF